MIPMDELEGWLHAGSLVTMMRSAVAANFNTLRVWGGGHYLPDIFYDTADELGLLIFHDMMFAQNGHAPKNTPTQVKWPNFSLSGVAQKNDVFVI